MKFGIIGLGKMGKAIAFRSLQAGHDVFGFDIDFETRNFAQKKGVKVVESLQELAQKVRIFWFMIPAEHVDRVIDELFPFLQKEDIIIDGGNSHFNHSVSRARRLLQDHIYFLDCGTSGGLLGEKNGFSLTIGGDVSVYEKVVSIFEGISVSQGFDLVGPSGAGHYVKMVHNAIEYGLLEAYAEGFHLLHDGVYADLNLEKISEIWLHGSIIRSLLLELALEIFQKDQEFNNVLGSIEESGTALWAIEAAKQIGMSVPVIEASLRVREQSQKMKINYATKLIALLRHKFGGHKVDMLED